MKFIFYLLVLLLPTQLGRHFWPNFSFIQGIRVDYLSPTVYLTDLLIVLLFLIEIFKKYQILNILGRYRLFGLLVVFLLINIYFSQNPFAGLLGLTRFIEFSFLGFFVAATVVNPRQISRITLFLAIGVFFESFLAIWQFLNQSSIGGIFWLFGERTFNGQTPGIAQAVIDGRLILRSYGTFPHPNILAGFLVVAMTLIMSNVKKIFFATALAIGTAALILTMSRVAILLWFLILVGRLITSPQLKTKLVTVLLLVLAMIILYFSGLFPRFTNLSLTDESFTRRSGLTTAAVEIIKTHPLMGIGLNNFLVNLPKFQQAESTILYLQPVHNIYLLVAAETGVVGLVFFLWFIGKTYQKVKSPLFIALTVILILGFFDHYFLTLQQGQLLFSLVLGLCWAKIKTDS